MNVAVKINMVIRPLGSKRGLSALIFLSLIGCFFVLIALFVFIIAPDGDAKARTMMMIFGIMSVITIMLGIILYFVFPRVKIIFNAFRKEAIIKTGSNPNIVIPFSILQPFQVYERYYGHSPRYYCRNGSFGEFSDLFFSTFHGKTQRKAQRLAELTGVTLVDNGKSGS